MSDTIQASDVEGLQDAITNNAYVQYATALAHDQGHTTTSASNHTDVSGETPSEGQTQVYDSSTGTWRPSGLVVSFNAPGIYGGTC